MRYIKLAILGLSFLFTSCNLYQIPSSKESSGEKTILSKQAEIEIFKRLEHPGDGDYFASNEMKLATGITLPIWDIPDLVDIEDTSALTGSYTIIKEAKTYTGTPYRFGGVTKKGMDCSGLIYTAFKANDIYLPRSSVDMSREGEKVNLKNVLPGDLVFFKTNRRRNVVNHVGIVVEGQGNEVKFIHSSTSRGVIISSIAETYWQRAFTEARRVL